ncbi:hypothetical protein [Acidovorax lacteus]|uniref:hypothetical protein n=1 Tax=Acidovorax lacteus TaxID=1924988 RepID=UPI0031E92AF6
MNDWPSGIASVTLSPSDLPLQAAYASGGGAGGPWRPGACALDEPDQQVASIVKTTAPLLAWR